MSGDVTRLLSAIDSGDPKAGGELLPLVYDELVKLRYFVGMSFEDTAAALGIAVPTAKQWWSYARACLRVEIAQAGPSDGETL